MEHRKLQLIEKMAENGISVAEAAEAISFDPVILALYLNSDAYPVPKRILDKLEGKMSN